MKYIYNKIIFRTAVALVVLLLGIGIYIQGTGLLKQSATITCPKDSIPPLPCEFTFENGSTLTLQQGETYEYNKQNKTLLNIINYGALLIALLSYLINHLLYNKNYNFKEINKEKITESFIKYLEYQFINPIKKIINIFKKKEK